MSSLMAPYFLSMGVIMKEESIEVIKGLHSLENGVDSSKFEQICEILNIDKKEYHNRTRGLEKEFEFLSNLYICGLIKSFIPIDEKLTTLIGEKSCDAILTLNDDSKIMVEVKSTSTEKYQISNKNFNDRVEWAKQHGYELFFAINIFDYWTVYSSTQIESFDLRVDDQKIQYSILSKLFGVVYYLSSDTKIITRYTTNSSIENLGINHESSKLFMISQSFYVDDELVDEITPAKKNNIPNIFLSEALKEMSSPNTESIAENVFQDTYILSENIVFSVFNLIDGFILKLHGNTIENKYEILLEDIKSNPARRQQIKYWLDFFAKTLKLLPFIMEPNMDN